MTRFLAVLAGFVCVLPAAPAAVSPKKPPAQAEGKAAVPKGPAWAVTRARPEPADADFVMTATTEVKLNGRPCRFKDVPDGAVITKIEVDSATRSVLVVHFSAGK